MSRYVITTMVGADRDTMTTVGLYEAESYSAALRIASDAGDLPTGYMTTESTYAPFAEWVFVREDDREALCENEDGAFCALVSRLG